MVKNYKCTVASCLKSYTTRPNMLRHVRLQHFMTAEHSDLKICRLRQLRGRANGSVMRPQNSRGSLHDEYMQSEPRNTPELCFRMLAPLDALRLTSYYDPTREYAQITDIQAELATTLPSLCVTRRGDDVQLPLVPILVSSS
jgi:hypothetical protein